MPDLAPWPIHATAMRRIATGINNETYAVEAHEGAYVLRIYRNTADVNVVHREHELLGRLALIELPFEVPHLVTSREGDTVVVLETPDGARLATLFAGIPGTPAPIDEHHARIGAAALAELDRGLAQIEGPLGRPMRSLRDVHPLVNDPLDIVDELGLADAERVHAILGRVEAEGQPLAASLPHQIIHGDFGLSNLLVRNARVTGIVDFEAAGPDIRAMDLATLIYITVVRTPPDQRWAILRAIVDGYGRVLPLDPAEIAALPALVIRHAAVSLVHWAGRWRQGLSPASDAAERAARLIRLDDWLEQDAIRLVAVASGVRK